MLTILNVSLPIPAGLFAPLLLVGAGIGRLIGEGISLFIESSNGVAGMLSVVGSLPPYPLLVCLFVHWLIGWLIG